MHRFSSSLLALLGAFLITACTEKPITALESDGVSIGIRTEPHPAALGDNQFRFWVTQNGTPMQQATVQWRMFMPGMPMNSDNTWITANPDGDRYSGVGDFSMGGDWQVKVQVTPSGSGADDHPVTVNFPYHIEWKLK